MERCKPSIVPLPRVRAALNESDSEPMHLMILPSLILRDACCRVWIQSCSILRCRPSKSAPWVQTCCINFCWSKNKDCVVPFAHVTSYRPANHPGHFYTTHNRVALDHHIPIRLEQSSFHTLQTGLLNGALSVVAAVLGPSANSGG
jgi:hypothetical protein